MNIMQETNVERSLVTGRNGTHKLKAVHVWDGNEMVYVDAIGRSGKTLNADLIIDKLAFNKLLEKLNEPEIEDNQRRCESKCPKCGAMGDDIVWDCSDTDWDEITYTNQTATCQKCKTDFCEVHKHVYQYTAITGDTG